MLFESLKEKSNTNHPTEILAYLKGQSIKDYNGYLLFNLDHKEETFFKNLSFLADESTWTKEGLDGQVLIAQTIDNDYLFATESSVTVIPYSFNKLDSEIFDLSIWDFLIAFEEKTLETSILALN